MLSRRRELAAGPLRRNQFGDVAIKRFRWRTENAAPANADILIIDSGGQWQDDLKCCRLLGDRALHGGRSLASEAQAVYRVHTGGATPRLPAQGCNWSLCLGRADSRRAPAYAMIDAVLLGTGGMMPLPNRWLSSFLIRVKGHLTLFDCGEGTQIAWRNSGWGFRRLGAICISHTHADHVAGLPGLLHAVANAGRTEPIEVFGPAGTGEVVRALRVIAPVLPYKVRGKELLAGERFTLPGALTGSCEPGEHA